MVKVKEPTLTSKISDFGLARRFKGYETRLRQRMCGYIPPEYAVHGVFLKSDVFSFSVLVLEIVSGMKKREFSSHEHLDNLLGHAWRLYKDGKCLIWLVRLYSTHVSSLRYSDQYTHVCKIMQTNNVICGIDAG
ncbi:putative protein kinase RLK-Pelle-DLSV family [Helianthus annuus]|nr:putative protein kinase RLK-Pelle-DLSV family [Helianthus annuus]